MEVRCDQGAVDRDVVERFAESMGVKFPEPYVEFISKHNGASLVKDIFIYKIDEKTEEGSFAFCGYGEWPIGDIINNFQDYDVYGYDNIVTFGCRGNGDYIFFDYRDDPKGDNPSIALMIHDDYVEDEEGDAKMIIVKVADTYSDFIKNLYSHKD